MPKEIVGRDSNNRVEVSWGRDSSHVQIATYCPSRLVAGTIPADVRPDGSSVAPDIGKDDITIESQPFTGWYADLTRFEINTLIQNLRRARDQAFGKDA